MVAVKTKKPLYYNKIQIPTIHKAIKKIPKKIDKPDFI